MTYQVITATKSGQTTKVTYISTSTRSGDIGPTPVWKCQGKACDKGGGCLIPIFCADRDGGGGGAWGLCCGWNPPKPPGGGPPQPGGPRPGPPPPDDDPGDNKSDQDKSTKSHHTDQTSKSKSTSKSTTTTSSGGNSPPVITPIDDPYAWDGNKNWLEDQQSALDALATEGLKGTGSSMSMYPELSPAYALSGELS